MRREATKEEAIRALKFRGPGDHDVERLRDIIHNLLSNEFPYPATLYDLYTGMQEEGFKYTLIAFKKQLYQLWRENRVERIKTFKRTFWLVRTRGNKNK